MALAGSPGEHVDDARQLLEGQVGAHVVHQLGQHGEGQRAQCLLTQASPTHQHTLIQQQLQLAVEAAGRVRGSGWLQM